MRRLAALLVTVVMLATTVACQSDDPRPTYTYRGSPAPRTSASRLPPPSRRLVAAPSPVYPTPSPARPRRAST
ncbi:MAG: hypothetical protein U1E39_14705 [Planctomycetota bacterium]